MRPGVGDVGTKPSSGSADRTTFSARALLSQHMPVRMARQSERNSEKRARTPHVVIAPHWRAVVSSRGIKTFQAHSGSCCPCGAVEIPGTYFSFICLSSSYGWEGYLARAGQRSQAQAAQTLSSLPHPWLIYGLKGRNPRPKQKP